MLFRSRGFESDSIILMIISGLMLIGSFEEERLVNEMSYSPSLEFLEQDYKIRDYMSKSSIPINPIMKEKILKQSYQIYLAVQEAWMNFDYETLRTLVTDELFNTYQMQLQTLELKGQKNIMSDFLLLDWKLLSVNEENSIRTISALMEVEFYDYIVDNKNKVLRGNKKKKVIMTYCLTFVDNEKSSNKCPHCGAQLEEGKTVCNYCGSHIQSVMGKMKLAKKEEILQRTKG